MRVPSLWADLDARIESLLRLLVLLAIPLAQVLLRGLRKRWARPAGGDDDSPPPPEREGRRDGLGEDDLEALEEDEEDGEAPTPPSAPTEPSRRTTPARPLRPPWRPESDEPTVPLRAPEPRSAWQPPAGEAPLASVPALRPGLGPGPARSAQVRPPPGAAGRDPAPAPVTARAVRRALLWQAALTPRRPALVAARSRPRRAPVQPSTTKS